MLQVSTNGLISFRRPFSSYSPEPFNSNFLQFDDPIIAPLWGDFTNFEGSNMFTRATNSPETLIMVVAQLTTVNQNFTSYNPTIAVVVTWDSIREFSSRSSVVCQWLSRNLVLGGEVSTHII